MKSFSDEDERVRLKEHALRYADGTSIHGIKYTCEPGRTLLENFILCIYLIIPIYTKWRQDPTFTTIKSTDYPVWNVHFPAVTLCSNIRVERKRLERALNTTQWQKILHKYHLETKKAAQDMMPLLDKVVNYIDLESGRFLGLNTSKPVQQIFEDNSDLVEELLKEALIHGPYEYAEVMNKGFAIGTGEEIFVGLSAVITESNAAVKEMNIDRRKCVKSDEDPAVLKAHNIELRVYQYYEKMSCLMECRAREILKSCNCLPYHYPKFGQFLNRSTACNLKGLFCLNTIINDMYAVSPDTEALSGGPDFVDGPKCNCPNACDGTQYLAEISKVELEPQSPYINQVEKRKGSTLNRRLIRTQKLQDIYLKLKNNSKMAEPWERHHQVQENYNLVHIYFKNLGAVYYTREQLYGIMDLIGAMGGIIGLCMGFSLLSGVEFLYFFTLRLWIDQDRARRKMKGKK
eukprot:maker-scaffold88_size394946-snap-gene-2.27 protein:Tk05799 transcript:maker-scaffold88_size394946-snap-gene-2.27-mRNA-1 annotation:"sodium channel protein nach-like"